MVSEKAGIEARLSEIAGVLGKGDSVGAVDVAALAPKKKRKMSAAGKAAIVAAQKARWAKIKAGKGKAEGK